MIEFGERKFISPTSETRTRLVGRFHVGLQLWTVYEDLEHGPSLVFETTGVARRVRQYPADWRGLTADELYAISWSR